jgi:hypothetical protein
MPATTRAAGQPGRNGPVSNDIEENMRKQVFSHILKSSLLILALSIITCRAVESGANPPATSGKKKLLLFAKHPATWAIVKGGGSGKLIYREATGAFTLNAAGLHPGSSYALIRYADAPPRAEILARGTSDEHGCLELAGVWRNWTRKFWLVSGEDVVGRSGAAGSLRAWRPDRYLFEEKLLGIDCKCPELEEQ